MKHPDWYRPWAEQALEDLETKNKKLEAEFGIGHWPWMNYDLNDRTLTFSEQGVVRVAAEIQLAGSVAEAKGDWQWAWGNPNWPKLSCVDSESVRRFGEEQGIEELTAMQVRCRDLKAFGWKMTAVMAHLTGAIGAYRRLSDGSGLYLTIKRMERV